MTLNRKYDLCWEAGCVENALNTMVFNRFLVYRKIEFEVSWDSFLVHSGRSLVLLGPPFSVFEGIEMTSKIRRNFKDSLGYPKSWDPTQLRVKCLSRGVVSLQFQNILAVKIQATRLEAVNSQDQKDSQGCKLTNM